VYLCGFGDCFSSNRELKDYSSHRDECAKASKFDLLSFIILDCIERNLQFHRLCQ